MKLKDFIAYVNLNKNNLQSTSLASYDIEDLYYSMCRDSIYLQPNEEYGLTAYYIFDNMHQSDEESWVSVLYIGDEPLGIYSKSGDRTDSEFTAISLDAYNKLFTHINSLRDTESKYIVDEDGEAFIKNYLCTDYNRVVSYNNKLYYNYVSPLWSMGCFPRKIGDREIAWNKTECYYYTEENGNKSITPIKNIIEIHDDETYTPYAIVEFEDGTTARINARLIIFPVIKNSL